MQAGDRGGSHRAEKERLRRSLRAAAGRDRRRARFRSNCATQAGPAAPRRCRAAAAADECRREAAVRHPRASPSPGYNAAKCGWRYAQCRRPPLLQARQDEPGAEARTIVLKHEAALMELRHAIDEAQSQTVAGLRPARSRRTKRLMTLSRSAGAMPGPRSATVMTTSPISARPLTAMRAPSAVRLAILHGVVDEVADRLGEQLPAGARSSGPTIRGERAALFLDERLVKLGHLAHDVRRIERLQALARVPGLGLGDREERIEGMKKAVGFLDRLGQRLLVVVLVAGAQAPLRRAP